MNRILHLLGLTWILTWGVLIGGHAAPSKAEPAIGRPVLDLSGQWEFKLDPLDLGKSKQWFGPSISYDRKIEVPGAWNAQGVTFDSADQLQAYEAKCLEEQKSLNQLGTLGVQRESERLFSTYPGPGWYRRQVTIPADWKDKIPWLIFDGVHREAEFWVNGKSVGTHLSYLIPFRVDLSAYVRPGETANIIARVDARRRKDVDPLMGCLDTLDFLYVTWGGLQGRVRLEATARTYLEDVFIVPDLRSDTVDLRVSIAPHKDVVSLSINAEIFDGSGTLIAALNKPVEQNSEVTSLLLNLPSAKRWSPKSPYLYRADIQLLSDRKVIDGHSQRFGMRDFKVIGGRFVLNGKPIFLRGYGDDCIFPETICPPSNIDEFRRRLAMAKSYGFNYVRHHSWTPPAEYLDAADELGMMLQPEFPFAYRWDLPTTPGAKRWAIEQWKAIIKLNRNHPSIVCWCMGNELYDSFEFASEMYLAAKRIDPTRVVIDSDGCNFKHRDRKSLDFLVVQFGEGHLIGYLDGKYTIPANVTKPVIAHEMGYFVTLPDLHQQPLFRHGIRPYWLDQTRNLIMAHDLSDVYPDWLHSSYRLQAVSLKCNLEAARRSKLQGTSVWLFQDYPNCAEGVVDMFFHPKGVSAETFKQFNAPTVLLVDLPKRSFYSGEIAEFRVLVSRFEDERSENASLHWKLSGEIGSVNEGVESGLKVSAEGIQELRQISIQLPTQTNAGRLTFAVELDDSNGQAKNSWDLWLFPRELEVNADARLRTDHFDVLRKLYPWVTNLVSNAIPSGTELVASTRLTERMIDYLESGGRVLLLDPETSFDVEKTNFRLSSWDGGGPSGTIVDPKHPVLHKMPTEGWCDLQFYPLIQGSKTIQLSKLPTKVQPLIRCIDRPTRLADRAYLFEVQVGRGRLIVSGLNFTEAIDSGDAAGRFFMDQIIRYALSSEFKPNAKLPVAELRTKLKP